MEMPLKTIESGTMRSEDVTSPVIVKVSSGRAGSLVSMVALWRNGPGGTVAFHSMVTVVEPPGLISVSAMTNSGAAASRFAFFKYEQRSTFVMDGEDVRLVAVALHAAEVEFFLIGHDAGAVGRFDGGGSRNRGIDGADQRGAQFHDRQADAEGGSEEDH